MADVVFSTQSYRKLQLKTRKKKENKKTNKTQKNPTFSFQYSLLFLFQVVLSSVPTSVAPVKADESDPQFRNPQSRSPTQKNELDFHRCVLLLFICQFLEGWPLFGHIFISDWNCAVLLGCRYFLGFVLTHFVVTSKTAARAVDADIYSPSMWQTTEDAYS